MIRLLIQMYLVTKTKAYLNAALKAGEWTYEHMYLGYEYRGATCGDIYMAACPYVYYRLYLLTGDDHYRDIAEFLNLNCKQANDVDGSSGYRYIGAVHEGGGFSDQIYRGRYHWLPWCTFVEVDPASRFYDTFGTFEIAEIEKLPSEERLRKNRIYDSYF